MNNVNFAFVPMQMSRAARVQCDTNEGAIYTYIYIGVIIILQPVQANAETSSNSTNDCACKSGPPFQCMHSFIHNTINQRLSGPL